MQPSLSCRQPQNFPQKKGSKKLVERILKNCPLPLSERRTCTFEHVHDSFFCNDMIATRGLHVGHIYNKVGYLLVLHVRYRFCPPPSCNRVILCLAPMGGGGEGPYEYCMCNFDLIWVTKFSLFEWRCSITHMTDVHKRCIVKEHGC